MRPVICAAALSVCTCTSFAQFDTATISATVTAQVSLSGQDGTVSDEAGGPFSDFFGGLEVSFEAMRNIKESTGNASSSESVTFTPTTIAASGSVSTDIDDASEVLTSGLAQADSILTVMFELTSSTQWSFDSLSIGGTHAGGSVTLFRDNNPKDIVFAFSSFGGPYKGETGILEPGAYTFLIGVSASTSANDGFGGLFAGASYDCFFRLGTPGVTPCPGDADGNGVVEFGDIASILVNFGTVYSPTTGPGDADQSGTVDFGDVASVLVNFGNTCS